MSAVRVFGANDKLNVGIVGLGGRAAATFVTGLRSMGITPPNAVVLINCDSERSRSAHCVVGYSITTDERFRHVIGLPVGVSRAV